jgi:hypothetical protein
VDGVTHCSAVVDEQFSALKVSRLAERLQSLPDGRRMDGDETSYVVVMNGLRCLTAAETKAR